ncbi:hypothetical protein F7734_13000 [Scytonema sp. UIC 10036]|uniref:hypothetical protein n=1 Tax=Scytonema sp. UIC 10036 TaxID=2304196 RepID=UPI0012DA1D9D|nr:hypothetical protein [Scytonema sp. UIC 10036]MUG93296.1 hypothetical protein [Scytonema sp. UIC 10036]
MPNSKRVRKSLSLPRFTPDEGTSLAIVADYYNDFPSDERSTLIRELLVMCLLPLALHKSGHTQKQVREAYLIARRMAENHFGIMAVELGLDARVYAYVPQPLSNPTVVDGIGGNGSTPPSFEEVSEAFSSAEDDSSLIPGLVDSGFMDNLFG